MRELGGLFIIGSERHEARRIDNQLRGRAGRQGDPGASRFFVSLEDELWRLFGDKANSPMLAGWAEDQAIDAKMLSAMIARAQKKVEMHHFDSARTSLDYDDVMNVQREKIYGERRRIMQGADLRETIVGYLVEVVEATSTSTPRTASRPKSGTWTGCTQPEPDVPAGRVCRRRTTSRAKPRRADASS